MSPAPNGEWTAEEQRILEKGLAKHPPEVDDPAAFRHCCAKIAEMLENKTALDVAHRVMTMNVDARKNEPLPQNNTPTKKMKTTTPATTTTATTGIGDRDDDQDSDSDGDDGGDGAMTLDDVARYVLAIVERNLNILLQIEKDIINGSISDTAHVHLRNLDESTLFIEDILKQIQDVDRDHDQDQKPKLPKSK